MEKLEKTKIKNETNTISFKVKSNFKQLLFIEIIKLIEYMTKVFIACSIFFLFLSMFIFNLEIQEFNHDFTKIQKRTCVIQQTSLIETIYTYFNEV